MYWDDTRAAAGRQAAKQASKRPGRQTDAQLKEDVRLPRRAEEHRVLHARQPGLPTSFWAQGSAWGCFSATASPPDAAAVSCQWMARAVATSRNLASIARRKQGSVFSFASVAQTRSTLHPRALSLRVEVWRLCADGVRKLCICVCVCVCACVCARPIAHLVFPPLAIYGSSTLAAAPCPWWIRPIYFSDQIIGASEAGLVGAERSSGRGPLAGEPRFEAPCAAWCSVEWFSPPCSLVPLLVNVCVSAS